MPTSERQAQTPRLLFKKTVRRVLNSIPPEPQLETDQKKGRELISSDCLFFVVVDVIKEQQGLLLLEIAVTWN